MISYHPLLRQQRELYNVPLGPQRFRAYLSLMLNEAQNEMELPLAAFNPMGKDAVALRLDQWLSLGADEIAAEAVQALEPLASEIEGDFRLALVLCDDRDGGWTNRAGTEFSRRFETGVLLRGGWIEGALWTSQEPSPELAREAILVAVYRAVYIGRHGEARTLREMLAQESFATRQDGPPRKKRGESGAEKALEIVAIYADSAEWSVLMACLFGDIAAQELGLHPLGMPAGGALRWALRENNFLR